MLWCVCHNLLQKWRASFFSLWAREQKTPSHQAPVGFALAKGNLTRSFHSSRGNTYHIQWPIKAGKCKLPQDRPHFPRQLQSSKIFRLPCFSNLLERLTQLTESCYAHVYSWLQWKGANKKHSRTGCRKSPHKELPLVPSQWNYEQHYFPSNNVWWETLEVLLTR